MEDRNNVAADIFRSCASEVDATVRTLALAAGEMSETAYSAWLKANSKRA